MTWMRSLDPVAVHESGHSAALLALGLLNGDVYIDGHGNGVTYSRHSLFFGTSRTRKDQLQISIAGPLAQSQVTRYSVETILESQTGLGGQGDGDKVLALIGRDSLDHWVSKTKRLISGYNRGIKDLAEALLDTGSVDGRTAAAILNGRR